MNLVPLLWTGVPTPSAPADRQDPLPIFRCPGNAFMLRWVFPDHLIYSLAADLSGACPLAKLLQDSRAPARPPPALQTQRACVAEAKRRAAAADAAHRAAALPRALTTLLAAAVSACPHRCCRARPCMEQYGVCAQSRCACKPSTNPVCVLLTAFHRGALQLENIAGLAQR